MSTLENTYLDIKKKFENDLELEAFPIVKSVDEHRRYWKPDNVRVILLAESHVFTSIDEYNNSMEYDYIQKLDGCPTNYVKLVYCLGYGERQLVNLDRNSGTWPFWRIFTSCVNQNPFEEFGKVEIGKTPNFNQRLYNKISLLEKLKENGVWLLDASIVALYKNNDSKQKKKMKEIIQICWDQYISQIINEISPEKIIVIGRGVANVLEEKLYKIGVHVDIQKQPNGIRNSAELRESFKKYYELCNS